MAYRDFSKFKKSADTQGAEQVVPVRRGPHSTVVDEDRLDTDEAYREDCRHRCLTDHFFLSEVLRPGSFRMDYHQAAFDLYFPKNPNLPIEEQAKIKNYMHLDPRKTRKTTLARIDKLQWILAFPETITILVESATHPLAKAVCEGIANYLCRYKTVTPLQKMFPELVVSKWPFHNDASTWNTSVKELHDLDSTLAFTSPTSKQSGWHPWIINADDMVETTNSGIHADDKQRRKVIDTFDTNRNTLQGGGYMYLVGTRYHPLDLYGVRLTDMDPSRWKVLIRQSLTVKNGQPLVPGEFPDEDELVLHFAGIPDMDYAGLREAFYANYESFMCFAAGSRVLMADWSEKSIEDVKVGDEVIGLEKKGPYDSRLVKTKVVRLYARRAETVESTTECGRKVRHTPDHRFLRPSNGGAMRYVKLRVGCKTVSIYKPMTAPTPAQQRDLDWLGGMLDGEGAIEPGAIKIYQKQEKNPEVYQAIIQVLDRLGIPHTHGLTHRTDCVALKGGRSLLIWLLNHSRMMKLDRVRKTLWRYKQHSETNGRGGGSSQPKIVSIHPIGEQMVYDIETETHNFVCEGFAVHNCQQQNDPKGGNVSTFDEKLYGSCEMPPERIPPYGGETYTCWRLPCGKKGLEDASGVAARILDGRVYVLDAFQGNWIPSKLAERMVQAHKKHQADAMLILATPGSEFMVAQVRNEAARKSVSIRIQWADWEESEERRGQQCKQLEPLMKVGRLLFSTGMAKAKECRQEFVNFGLVPSTGIIEVVSKVGDLVPMSQIRAALEDDEIEYHRRRNDDATINWLLDLQGRPLVDEQARRKAQAHQQAMEKATTYRMPALECGLDG
jgi:GNAT superfamily N-acetyltransferase